MFGQSASFHHPPINNNMLTDTDIKKELEAAVKEQNVVKVKVLLSAGDMSTSLKYYMGTLLHKTRCIEITKELLLAGAEVDARNYYGETPLHSAIKMSKDLEIVKALLKHGAYVNAQDRQWNNLLNTAVKKSDRNLGVIKELLKYGADINERNREQRLSDTCTSPLDNAIGSLSCAKLMIKFTVIMNFNKDYKQIIGLDRYTACRNYSELSTYIDDCVCELIQMKTDVIKDGFPLYEIVTDNFNIPNNQLSVRLALTNNDYSINYPIYNDIIVDKIKPYLERADLLKKLSNIQFYTKLDLATQSDTEITIVLDHASTYKITEYLSNDNLLNFIKAFDISKMCAVQPIISLGNLVESGTPPNASNDAKRLKLK